MTADGAKRQASLPNEARGSLVGPQSASPQARCLSRGAFGSMLPIGNSSGNQIVQSPGVVVLRNEMINEARVIPVDGRPAVSSHIRAHMGVSLGRWEKDTLVVETAGFKEGGGSGPSRLFTPGARMTERFTRTDADTIEYQVDRGRPADLDRPVDGADSLEARSALLPVRVRLPRGQLPEHDVDAGRERKMRTTAVVLSVLIGATVFATAPPPIHRPVARGRIATARHAAPSTSAGRPSFRTGGAGARTTRWGR